MTAATRIDHVAAALARLPVRLQKQRWQELLTVLVEPFQFYEDILIELLRQDDPRQASGHRLDQIGASVGVARDQREDAAYLRAILAKIATNRSRGLVTDVLLLARLLVGDDEVTKVLTRTGTASYLLSLEGGVVDTAVAAEIAAALPRTHAAGVNAGLYHHTIDPSLAFSFDGGPGPGYASGVRASVTIPPGGTVVRLRSPGIWGNEHVFELVAATVAAEGELDEVNLSPFGGIVYYNFLDGSSTVADLETAIAASPFMELVTASGSPSTVLTSAHEGQSFFTGGTDAGGVFARRHLE